MKTCTRTRTTNGPASVWDTKEVKYLSADKRPKSRYVQGHKQDFFPEEGSTSIFACLHGHGRDDGADPGSSLLMEWLSTQIDA